MSAAQPIAAIRPVKVPANQPGTPGLPATRKGSDGRGADGKESDSKAEVARIVNAFQSDTTEIDTQPEPILARAVIWALAVFVTGAVIWASIAHIDRVVSAQGRIVSLAPNVVVQSLETAVIKTIDVRVGDVVKAGAVLATLDPTFAEADVGQLEARLASMDAAIARLEAEQTSRRYAATPNNRFDYDQLQEAIWKERRTQFEAQMRLFEEREARVLATIVSNERERQHFSQRLQVVREIEGMRLQLEKAETGSRLNSLVARDTRIEVERNLTRAETSIVSSQHELDGIKAEREVFRRQWDSRVIEELVTKRNERDSLVEQLVKAQRRKDMIQLVTPVDAVVLEIAGRSVGSIIKDAEPFFSLVPLNAPLEIEANVEARQIGRIAEGDPVQIKLEAYPYQEHGMVEGTIKSISGDAFTDNRNNPDAPAGAFYRIRVAMSEVSLRNVPDNFRLIPGLPLTAEIKVGDRSIIGYLLRPILRGVNESMREP